MKKSDNPFAIVVMAHLKTQDTRHDEQGRKRWKLYLVKRLYERGYRKEDVINLFRFIDWIMGLSEEMEESFWVEMHQYEEGEKMEYITSVERIGIKKGIQQGILQKAREAVIEILEIRFEVVPGSIVKTINRIDEPSILKMLLNKGATVGSLPKFKQIIDLVMK